MQYLNILPMDLLPGDRLGGDAYSPSATVVSPVTHLHGLPMVTVRHWDGGYSTRQFGSAYTRIPVTRPEPTDLPSILDEF